jgi:hypothetical protein
MSLFLSTRITKTSFGVELLLAELIAQTPLAKQLIVEMVMVHAKWGKDFSNQQLKLNSHSKRTIKTFTILKSSTVITFQQPWSQQMPQVTLPTGAETQDQSTQEQMLALATGKCNHLQMITTL